MSTKMPKFRQRSVSNQDAIASLQEVYGRIRLCSRMLADHFIPSYLGSLQSALALVSSNYGPLGVGEQGKQ